MTPKTKADLINLAIAVVFWTIVVLGFIWAVVPE